MYKIILVIIAGFVITAIGISPAIAGCGMCPVSGEKAAASGGSEQAKGTEVVNSVCPVMDAQVPKDTPYTLSYKGKTIGFCCASCVEAFKATPGKYEANIETAKDLKN